MFGELIKKRLVELDLSQSDLARESGFSRQYISDLCTGKCGGRLPLRTANKLAKALRLNRKFFYLGVSGQNDTLAVGADKVRTADA